MDFPRKNSEKCRENRGEKLQNSRQILEKKKGTVKKGFCGGCRIYYKKKQVQCDGQGGEIWKSLLSP